jgi:hypothetical protein
VKARAGRSETVKAPRPAPLISHEPGPTQVGKVPRRRRLGDAQNGYEIPYTQRAFAEKMEDADPGWIRESAEDALDGENLP